MAGELGSPFKLGIHRDGNSKAAECLSEEYKFTWYVSRKEIEICSPSWKDGIDLRKETELRMWYCSFLKDIGIKLGVPQVTIATAIMFCHRFYLHQSHAKNEWQTVATVCMFLASKVEDTPCPLDKVIVVAYETMYKKDPAAARRIHQKDVFAKQKERILIGETLLLSTLRFDCNVQHPYKPLLGALKKFGIIQKEVTQAAWNFVNDSLRTTLCLQYKPHYIAAGSVFLAAKLYNVRLPSQRGYVWWNEFDVMPQLLNAAIHEMAEQLGYKGRTMVVARMVEKPTQNQLVAKQEMSSSPDSCLSSMPDLSKSNSSQDFQRPAMPVDSKVRDPDSERACASGGAELVCRQSDSENPRGSIVNFKTPGNAEHRRVDKIKEMEKKRITRVDCVVARDSTSGRAESQCQGRIRAPGKGEEQVRAAMDLERIKELAKKRKRERETVKRTDVTDEEAWIERELETGIEVAAGPGKKLRLSQGYEAALIIVRRK